MSKLAIIAACCPVVAMSSVVVARRGALDVFDALSATALCWTLLVVLVTGVVLGLLACQRCAESRGRLRGEMLGAGSAVISALLILPAMFMTGVAQLMSNWGSAG